MNRKTLARLCAAIGLSVVFTGCASAPRPSGFLGDTSRLQEGEVFKREYVAWDAHFSNYEKVQVASVDLSHLENRSAFEEAELRLLASRFEEELRQTLSAKYVVLPPFRDADASTLVVRPALISVGTPHRVLNAATTIFVGPLSSGSAAFEAELADGARGTVLAQVAERRQGGGDAKSLTVGAYQKFTHTEAAFQKWAENLVKFLEARP